MKTLPEAVEKILREKITKRCLEIAGMADRGDDKAYGHALAQLAIDTRKLFAEQIEAAEQRGADKERIRLLNVAKGARWAKSTGEMYGILLDAARTP